MTLYQFVNNRGFWGPLPKALPITLVWMLLALPAAFSQNQAECSQQLEQAQTDYQQGKIYKVLGLEDCVAQLPLWLKDDAYLLLFKSYVLVGNDSMANVSMQNLLRENPNIEPKNEDEKFQYFYQKFESRPSEIGLMIGQNVNMPNSMAAKNAKSFNIGLVHNHLLRPHLYIFTNFLYAERTNILDQPTDPYEMPGIAIGQQPMDEAQAAVLGVDAAEYPVKTYHLAAQSYPAYVEGASGFIWGFLSKKRFEVFLQGGLAINYLFETTFDEGKLYELDLTYEQDGQGGVRQIPPTEPARILAEAYDAKHQTKVNAHYLGGAGVRVNINKGIAFFGVRYQRGIFPQKLTFISNSEVFNQTLSDYQAEKLTFQTETLSFNFGYLFRLQHFRSPRD